MLSEKQLQKYTWNDISIVDINDDGSTLLILIFDSMESGNNFMETVLNDNPYKVLVSVDAETGIYSFTIAFIESELVIKFTSTFTAENYPPVKWIGNGNTTFITNGVWQKGQTSGKKKFIYNPEILALDDELESMALEDNIAKVFSKALRIDFWSRTEPSEPDMAILVFEKRQAATAYNNLLDLASSTTTFLKIKESDTLEISFVDAVNDFHITVSGLVYQKEQLQKFKANLVTSKSFGFLISIDNPGADRPMIIQTKENFEIITIAGIIE